MGLHINSFDPRKWQFTRFSNGDSFLQVGRLSTNYKSVSDLFEATMDNYALFICLKISSDICAKARLEVVDRDGNVIDEDPLPQRLHKPNYLQTGADFIKQWIGIN